MKTKTINETFTEDEIEPSEKLKNDNSWTWKELIKITTEFYVKNNKEAEE